MPVTRHADCGMVSAPHGLAAESGAVVRAGDQRYLGATDSRSDGAAIGCRGRGSQSW